MIRHKPFKNGFTLTELFIGLLLIGILAILIISTVFNSNTTSETKIAESIKSDISKAFQLSNTKSGITQQSEKPSNVVSKALNLSSPKYIGTRIIEYTTNKKWRIQIPNTWTKQINHPDSAIVKVISEKNKTYTFSVYRYNTSAKPSTLADINTVTLVTNPGSNGTTHTTNANINPTPNTNPTYWVSTVNVSSSSNGAINGATVTGSSSNCGSGTTNTSGNAIIGNIINGETCSYTASKTGYTSATSSPEVIHGNKVFNIIIEPITYTATITVLSSNDSIIENANVTGTNNCGSGTTNANGVLSIPNIANGTTCTFTASKAGFDSTTSTSTYMDSNKNITIKMNPLISCSNPNNYTLFNGKCYEKALIRNVQNFARSGAHNGNLQNYSEQFKITRPDNPINWIDFFDNTIIYLGNDSNKIGTMQNVCDFFSITPCTGRKFYHKLLGALNTGDTNSNKIIKTHYNGNGKYYLDDYLKDNTMITTYNGVEYNIVDMLVSPVKVALNGIKTTVNSDNHFYFDADGFNENNFPIIKTSGGLNSNEAWLITDREHNGIMFDDGKTQILDGNDVFGDHLGKYKSGYENLADTYKQYIQVDTTNKHYLALHKVSWLEANWMTVLRFFHLAQEPTPSTDLYLLDIHGNTQLASELLTRIDVDYADVKEFDAEKKNVIFQRGNVSYTDGHIAQGADQWFSPVIALKPIESGHEPMVLDFTEFKKAQY